MTKFSIINFFWRWLFAFLLVGLTYNPTEYSLYHWLSDALPNYSAITPVMAVSALLLLIGWVIYLRATVRSLGMVGTTLAVALWLRRWCGGRSTSVGQRAETRKFLPGWVLCLFHWYSVRECRGRIFDGVYRVNQMWTTTMRITEREAKPVGFRFYRCSCDPMHFRRTTGSA